MVGYATPESIAKNKAIRLQTKEQRRTRCDTGIAQLNHDEVQRHEIAW